MRDSGKLGRAVDTAASKQMAVLGDFEKTAMVQPPLNVSLRKDATRQRWIVAGIDTLEMYGLDRYDESAKKSLFSLPSYSLSKVPIIATAAAGSGSK